MQPVSPPEILKAAKDASKDRAFGEYAYTPGHKCPCYADKGTMGPPQYEPGDVYFCFAKFPNPFWKPWIARYVAMAVFFPTIDLIHAKERELGRATAPPEWLDMPKVITTHAMKTTVKGMLILAKKAENWLRANMIDEIDHRLVRCETPEEWKEKERELVNLYGGLKWARLGLDGSKWMRLHSATNTLEMLRQTDYAFTVMPPKYEEPPKEAGTGAETEKKTKAASGAIAELESVETTAIEQQDFLTEETRKDLT